MDWNDLRFILAIARAGTLTAAARRLGVDQTTVARRLKAAEAGLGCRLFARIDGRLAPTEAGEAAAERAERMESEVRALSGALGGSDAAVEGVVRLTAVPTVINRIVIPRLGPLLARHPGLRIEAAGESSTLNPSKREADIALRLARPTEGAALCRRLATLPYAVYGPAGHVAENLPWITYEERRADLPQARWMAGQAGAAFGGLRVDDAEALLQAVKAGHGKTVLPDYLAAGEPGLIRLSAATPTLTRELWLLVHPEIRHLARIAAVVDWLEAAFADATEISSPT